MSTLLQVDTTPLTDALSNVATFVPLFLAFLAILVIGWFVAKGIATVLDRVLERVGFDRAVERGGVKRALARSRYDASDLLSKLVFYTIFLFALQMAFSVFGENPISDLLFSVIAFLPKIFVAIVIIVVAAAIAAGAKEIVEASIGGLSYGRLLARLAAAAIMVIGVFAALNQIEIAPEIVNGLFYAMLAIIAGSAIIAIGGGGIQPMRAQWERAMTRVEEEAPRLREEAQGSSEDIRRRAALREQQATGEREPVATSAGTTATGATAAGSTGTRTTGPGTPDERTVQLPEDTETRRR